MKLQVKKEEITHGTEILFASRDFAAGSQVLLPSVSMVTLGSPIPLFGNFSLSPEICAILRIKSEFQDQSWNLYWK